MSTLSRVPVLAALALLLPLVLPASNAHAFRIIATSSGNAGIAQAPCCDTAFDGGFESSTAPFTGSPLLPNVMDAGGSVDFVVPRPSGPGESRVNLSGQARASLFDIGARASVDIENWFPEFTGESIEVFSSARLEQVITPMSAADVYLRPVFQLEGSMSHAGGLTSSLTFNLRATLPGNPGPTDNILLDLDGGTPGTTDILDLQLIGPNLFVAAGSAIFLSMQLSAQVSGNTNDVAIGNQFGEVDVLNTLTLIGFESFADSDFSIPLDVDFTSDSGQAIGTVPEPGTGLLVGFGLVAMGWGRSGRGDRTSPGESASPSR